MDICLIETKEGTHIRAESIHGILWLQTHFEEKEWELISGNQVIIANSEAKYLLEDASLAGLILNYLPVISSNLANL